MSRKKEQQKLRVSTKRMVIIFSILFLVMETIFYFSFLKSSFYPFDDVAFYVYTPLLLAASIFFCVLSIRSTYYIIDTKKLIHSKMGVEKEYYWKDIIFIDEEWSKKHKMLLFYMADGKDRYLAFDKDGLIYEYAINYARLISEEEFLARFPKVKL